MNLLKVLIILLFLLSVDIKVYSEQIERNDFSNIVRTHIIQMSNSEIIETHPNFDIYLSRYIKPIELFPNELLTTTIKNWYLQSIAAIGYISIDIPENRLEKMNDALYTSAKDSIEIISTLSADEIEEVTTSIYSIHKILEENILQYLNVSDQIIFDKSELERLNRVYPNKINSTNINRYIVYEIRKDIQKVSEINYDTINNIFFFNKINNAYNTYSKDELLDRSEGIMNDFINQIILKESNMELVSIETSISGIMTAAFMSLIDPNFTKDKIHQVYVTSGLHEANRMSITPIKSDWSISMNEFEEELNINN